MKGNKFLAAARGNLSEIRQHRRDFHRHPEVGFQEHRTAKKVARYLDELGLEVETGVAETGVVGLLRCGGSGRTAALRADIDALPLQEKSDVAYASANPGVMHACGHDAHTAIVMEAARLLAEEAEDLRGNVKFIFQPCEDTLPGGAEPMIEEGVLEDPDVDGVFSLHVAPPFSQGTMWVKSGYTTISSASFYLTLKGQGGHVAAPDSVVDPIGMAGMLITSSQSLMLRRVSPGETMIFGFGTVSGGTATNIIPDEVTLSGSIRAATPDERDRAVAAFERMVNGVTTTAGGDYEMNVDCAYPPVRNDPVLVRLMRAAGAKVLGEENVHRLTKVFPAGDDAAYFQEEVPGVYWYLGTKNPAKGFDKPLHSPYFDFDEDVLALGAAVQAQAVRDFLTDRDD